MNWIPPTLIGLAVLATFGAVIASPREHILSSYSSSVTQRTASQRHNARLALSRLTGATIPPGAVFSFNERVGSFSRDRGFRKAPVSYNGQLIDDWGGGVCQTSSTLYNAALLGNMVILERNHHRFAPSYVPPGRDAAVAFTNIDLRFRNPYSFPIRIEGGIVGGRLTVSLIGTGSQPVRPEVRSVVSEISHPEQFVVGKGAGRLWVRNSGKAGCSVTVIRSVAGRQEVISRDFYPAMNRVVQIGSQ